MAGCCTGVRDSEGVRRLVMQIASDGLKGRVFDVSLADLQKVRRCGFALAF